MRRAIMVLVLSEVWSADLLGALETNVQVDLYLVN